MTSRRAFARTATDISLLPRGFTPTEQALANSASELVSARSSIPGLGVASGSIHVVPYLTPNKVSILILIEYYCQSQCPPESTHRLLLFLLKCIQDPEEYLQDSLNKISVKVQAEAGVEIWDHLRNTLKRIKSPHHLSDFFLDKLDLDVSDSDDVVPRRIGLKDLALPASRAMQLGEEGTIILDNSSVMGLYVRKAQIEYKKLKFREMCELYTALEDYISAIGKVDHHFQSKDTASIRSEGSRLLSAFDMEKYLDLQAQQLSNPGHADIPDDLMAHVHTIQSRMPQLAKTHYITCLHAQQTGDFEVAIQSLYRFFDYTMATHDRVLYQYALLNLAMLHARFSHYEQALSALRETIEVARDHQDQECLSYALNWFYRLAKKIPGSSSEMNEAQILASLGGQADGHAFQYLHSLTELTVAKQMQGESMSKALEALVKASSINLRYSLDGVGGIIQLFQSRTWGAFGSPLLSSLYSQLQLKYHASEADMNDAASGYSKAASDLAQDGRMVDAIRVIDLARSKFPLRTMKATSWVQTLVQTLQRRAMSANRLREAKVLTHQLGTTLASTSILTSSSNNDALKGDGSTGSPMREQRLDDSGQEIQLEILLQKALLSVLEGRRLSGAQQLSEALVVLQQNQWPGTHKFAVMYLLALAEIYLESDTAISAVPLLLTALTLSENNLQRPLMLLVKLRLSEALLSLDSVRQASRLVDGIMPMRIESLRDVSQVLYFQVRVAREFMSPEEIESALRLFKDTSVKLATSRNKHEPSWFTYYYARDAFEGILGAKDSGDKQPGSSGSTARSTPAPHGQGSSGGLKRAGSGQWGSLKRSPSQLWQSTTATQAAPRLPPPDEREERSGTRPLEDEEGDQEREQKQDSDMDMDMDLDTGSDDDAPGGDDPRPDAKLSKRRRIARND
ncbi:Anaphase-promoting complex subunit 5 [Dissophora globulifera]|uniref:Anaphase-promoting complex subunit 5 n=1 Tax=Dissophora globulifera TaxID=979702 RepID=A0A9P6RVF3_9FUNG|nr:Anaphase-promoting complex subunit 5 [Dissophora globulifera]